MTEKLNGSEGYSPTEPAKIPPPVPPLAAAIYGSILQLRYKKLDQNLPHLKRGSERAAGIDLFNAGPTIEIPPLKSMILSNGIAIEIPDDHFGLVTVRSGLGMRGLASHIGVIDSDFRGELRTKLFNFGHEGVVIKQYERIANLVIIPYYHCYPLLMSELSDTIRGENGYGSTGTH